MHSKVVRCKSERQRDPSARLLAEAKIDSSAAGEAAALVRELDAVDITGDHAAAASRASRT
jgi:hypothetical protein